MSDLTQQLTLAMQHSHSKASMTHQHGPAASGPSGVRRAVMSIKSVKHVALSQAAKATIIQTIADNALASFIVIQVSGMWLVHDVVCTK